MKTSIIAYPVKAGDCFWVFYHYKTPVLNIIGAWSKTARLKYSLKVTVRNILIAELISCLPAFCKSEKIFWFFFHYYYMNLSMFYELYISNLIIFLNNC